MPITVSKSACDWSIIRRRSLAIVRRMTLPLVEFAVADAGDKRRPLVRAEDQRAASLELRIATMPSMRATSTHAPVSHRLLLRQWIEPSVVSIVVLRSLGRIPV